MNKTQRIIITGGPGTGKSTILQHLEERGYPSFSEVSRAVIKKELEKEDSEILPWRDLSGFSDVVFNGQMAQYRRAEAGKINFYDRGLIDVIAYLRKDLLDSDALESLVEHYPYHKTVFITPPWPEIYSQDEERREDPEAMQAIHKSLVSTYKDFDYEIIEVPKAEAETRTKFVLNHLGF